MIESSSRRRHQLRAIAVAAIVGFCLAYTANGAAAATVISSTKVLGSYGGKTFLAETRTSSSPEGGPSGRSHVRNFLTDGSTPAPAGWFGAQARTYKASGLLCVGAPMTYSSTPLLAWNSYTFGNCGAGAQYYGGGLTQFWQGTGYSGTIPAPLTNKIVLP